MRHITNAQSSSLVAWAKFDSVYSALYGRDQLLAWLCGAMRVDSVPIPAPIAFVRATAGRVSSFVCEILIPVPAMVLPPGIRILLCDYKVHYTCCKCPATIVLPFSRMVAVADEKHGFEDDPDVATIHRAHECPTCICDELMDISHLQPSSSVEVPKTKHPDFVEGHRHEVNSTFVRDDNGDVVEVEASTRSYVRLVNGQEFEFKG